MSVKYIANIGIEAISIDAADLNTLSVGVGSEFALTIAHHGVPSIAWQVFINGTVSAIVTHLEASLDGTNWFTVDTSESITGGIRTIIGPFRFVRINNESITEGAGTLTVSFVYSNAREILESHDETFYNEAGLSVINGGSGSEEVMKTVTIPANTLSGSSYTGFEVLVTFRTGTGNFPLTANLRIGGLAGTLALSLAFASNGALAQLHGTFQKNSSTSLNMTGVISQISPTIGTLGAASITGLDFTSTLDVTITAIDIFGSQQLILTSMLVKFLRRKS